jgi:uncharacterized protein (UPF0262 family)
MSDRLIKITLDEGSIKKRSAEVEHERNIAIADLLDENMFQPLCMKGGPYELFLSVSDGRLIFDIASKGDGSTAKAVLSIAPLRGIIRDYFMICESYYEALKVASPGKIEAIDMGRRGVHNEGSETLQEVLKGRISVDFPTARRLFTLICVLHIK